MAITEHSVFVTDDGKEHRTVQAAQEWELLLTLTRKLNSGTMLTHSQAEEAVIWFLQRYELTTKED